MLGLGCGGFLVEDAIFLMEKAKDILRSRLGFNGVEGRWSFFGKDSDDSRMQCLKSVLGMKKVNLIKRSSELYEFIDRVCIEIHEIHTDLNDAAHGFHL